MTDEELGYRGPTAEASLGSESGASSVDAGAAPRVRVSITSPVASAFLAQSYPDLEIGDVIILEAREQLLLGAESSSTEAQSICLISALHITSSGIEGEGGWKEDTVRREGGN